MKRLNVILETVETETIFDEQGELKSTKKTVKDSKVISTKIEPYVKLMLKSLGKNNSNIILMSLQIAITLAEIGYKNKQNPGVAYINTAYREDISARLGITKDTFNQHVRNLKKKGYLKCVKPNCYMVNPRLVNFCKTREYNYFEKLYDNIQER